MSDDSGSDHERALESVRVASTEDLFVDISECAGEDMSYHADELRRRFARLDTLEGQEARSVKLDAVLDRLEIVATGKYWIEALEWVLKMVTKDPDDEYQALLEINHLKIWDIQAKLKELRGE